MTTLYELIAGWERETHHHHHHHHRKLCPAWIRRLELTNLYFEGFTMSTATLVWTLPPEDAADAKSVDVFDGTNAIGSVDPSVLTFTSQELAPGDHSFTVIVRSKAGAEFDSDASNAAAATVPAPSVKLTAVSDLSVTLT